MQLRVACDYGECGLESSLTTKSAVVRVRSTLQRDLHSGPVFVVQFGLQIRLFRNQVTSDSDFLSPHGETVRY
jgi:hypothetical protein